MSTKADVSSNSGTSNLDVSSKEDVKMTSPGSLPEVSRPEKSSKNMAQECEFAIAADLTLYANPLRCLKKTAKPPAPDHGTGSGSDMIAADLIKYGSPLDDKPN